MDLDSRSCGRFRAYVDARLENVLRPIIGVPFSKRGFHVFEVEKVMDLTELSVVGLKDDSKVRLVFHDVDFTMSWVRRRKLRVRMS